MEDNIKGSFVKVVVEGTDIQLKGFDSLSMKKKLISQGALGVRFEFKRTDGPEQQVREARISREATPEQMFNRYMDYAKESGQVGNLDLGKIRSMGLRAIKESIK